MTSNLNKTTATGHAWLAPNPPVNLDEARRRVDTIDLSMIKMKLQDPEEGKGWDLSFADEVEERYRRFLCMVALFGDESIVPTKDIDSFWHQHILDTHAYAADCRNVFGEFMHHYPYFGMNGAEDELDLYDSFANTKRVYMDLFGEDYLASGVVNAKCCKKCGSKCGSSKCHHPRAN